MLALAACKRTSAPVETVHLPVAISRDGVVVATIDLATQSRVDLATIVPADAWKDLVATSGDGRRALVQRPTVLYAKQHAIVDVVDGRPRFAMLRDVDPTLPPEVRAAAAAPTVALAGVSAIEIRTTERVVAPPAAESVVVVDGTREVARWPVVEFRDDAPDSQAHRHGVDLRVRLAKLAPDRAVALVGRDGKIVTFDHAALATRELDVRLNRRGQAKLRVRIADKIVDEVTDLVRVELR